jgi:hypothetical protein
MATEPTRSVNVAKVRTIQKSTGLLAVGFQGNSEGPTMLAAIAR